MQNSSRFRIDEPSGAAPAGPESLFWDLKQRPPRIQYLWSHQADIFRTWHQNYLTSKDIALELATGTGKTLIGLFIADSYAVTQRLQRSAGAVQLPSFTQNSVEPFSLTC